MEAGDMKAMREALVAIKEVNDTRPHDAKGYEINDIITKALSESPRQCDVGTAKEQEERWFRFCQQNHNPFSTDTCLTCDARANARECGCETCGVSWAQMPYKEGATDGSK